MLIGVLTHKNFLVSKELYRKVFHRIEANFHFDTPRGLKIYLTGGGTDRKLISELQVTKLLVRLQNIFKVTGYYKFQNTKLDM